MWLIVIGSAILAVAAGMWMFQGRLKDVKNIINKGFQTVEDGIKDNLLRSQPADGGAGAISHTAGVTNRRQPITPFRRG